MAKAASLENNLYPFGGFGSNSAEKVLKDDYVHDNLEVWKFKSNTNGGSVVEYKGTTKLGRNDQSKLNLNYSDELKITFPVAGTGAIVRLLTNRKNDIEANVDFGSKDLGGKPVNLFANFKSKFAFDTIGIRFGANYFSSGLNYSAHLETDLNKPVLWQRITGNKDKINYGAAFKVDFEGNLSQYDTVLGYKDKDFDIYLKHVSDSKVSGVKPQVLAFQAVYRNKDTNVAATVDKDLNDSAPIKAAQLGIQTKVSGKDVRVKVDNNLNAAVSYKGACGKYNLNYVLGAGLGLKTIGQTGSGKAFPVDFGWKADLNI